MMQSIIRWYDWLSKYIMLICRTPNDSFNSVDNNVYLSFLTPILANIVSVIARCSFHSLINLCYTASLKKWYILNFF